MSVMASQISGISTVCSTVFRRIPKKASKLRVTGLFARKTPVTERFSSQRLSNAESVPFDDIIIYYERLEGFSQLHWIRCTVSIVVYRAGLYQVNVHYTETFLYETVWNCIFFEFDDEI